MPQKTKTKPKKTWLWVLLVVVGFFIVITIGMALFIFIISQVANKDKATETMEYYPEETFETKSLVAPEEEFIERSPELYQGDEAGSPVITDDDTAAGEVSESKVIKIGNLTIEVKEIDETSSDIINIAKNNNGFVLSSNTWTSSRGEKSGSITIKVPDDRFEDVFEEVKGLAIKVEREDVSGQDVTEQFSDLQAQLKNHRAEEEQYQKILEQATTVDDILKVTRQLSLVRANIERIEGRLKYLENVTDFSTITAYLNEGVKVEVPTSEWRPLNNLKTAFSYWVKALQWLLNFAVWMVIFLGPVAAIFWLIIWLIRRRGKERK